jgi:signal peptidase II
MPVMLIALVVAVADQAAKHAVLRTLVLGEARPVIPGFFTLTHVRNPGAVWGLFPGQGAALILLSLVSLGVLALLHRRAPSTARVRTALGLMAGGILGNLGDRLAYGYVVDFLDFHAAGWHWPAFNLADAAICAGIGLYLLASWTASRPAADGAAVPTDAGAPGP